MKKCFIEMSICAGSCVGGPAMERERRRPVTDTIAVNRYAGKKDFVVEQPDKADLIKDHRFIGLHRQMPGERGDPGDPPENRKVHPRAGAQLWRLWLQHLP